ncbi:putative phthiocerol dimycocerosate transporter LppX [Mycobacterium lacus]|uniref:Putative phthiocerol dimycocerosate transporter LppX n=1 Tax=Mycobacterium lacus TaxID=169765 RepID=A0A7I7NPZ2_9MYCO|nr:putative phthiocerol dimycocerosate transporter LppX [Mycobacterium lacus]
MRSAVLVALGVCLALWLSGCSADKPAAETHPSVSTTADPALVAEIRQSLDATKALTSAHLAIRTTGKVDSMLGISTADVDVRANPLAAKGVCTYNDEAGVPFRVKDDNISVKLFDDWSNLGSVSELSASRLIDPINGVTKLLEGVTNLQSQGTEVIGGIATTKIAGTLPTDAVKILDPGARNPRPATVWIAQDGSHRLVKARVDLGPGSVEVTLSKWNEPVNVD